MEVQWSVMLLFLWMVLLPYVDSSVVCEYEICNGDGAYCCSDGFCCYDYEFYHAWWFFVAIIVPVVVIATIIVMCCRRRRARRLAVMRQSQYPVYGTTVGYPPRGAQQQMAYPGAANKAPYTPAACAQYYGYQQQQQPQQPYQPQGAGYAPPPSYADSEGYKQQNPPPYSGP